MSDPTPQLDSILGQPEAVASIRNAFALHRLAGAEGGGPLAFLFTGPEGCGKGFAAQCLATTTAGERPVMRIPMATYQSDNEAAGLIGLRAIYKTAHPGELTSFVRQHPDALIVFEDFDRAHPNVQDVLAPLLARGALVDQCGFWDGAPGRSARIAPAEVDFRRTITIFTTTLGRRLHDDEQWLADRSGLARSTLVKELAGETSDLYDPGMSSIGRSLMAELAKIDCIMFRRLDLDALLGITERQFALLGNMAAKAGLAGLRLGDGSPRALRQLLTAVVLANGPEPKPALLEARDLARHYLTPFLLAGDTSPVTVAVDLGKEAKNALAAALDELGPQPLRTLFRKNQTLDCRPRIETGADGQARIVIDSCQLIRVPSRRDFGGIGGLVADMPDQRFADIAGHAGAKRRLAEVIDMLRAPATLDQWQVAPPRGLLLYGPPGTGKTMLARAFASEAELPFIATTGSELLDPCRIGRVFALARRYAPAAIFIDEIDALGRRDSGGAAQSINQLLAEIDGFGNRDDEQLFVIAATNLPERVDPALLRAGRIDLQILIPALDREARGYFIDRLRPMARLPRQAWQHIIDLTAGMSGADLEKLRRELAYDLIRQRRKRATRDDIVEHINTLKYGVRDTRERTREDLEHVAYHEAGHILLTELLNPEVKVRNISLVTRGASAGLVEFDLDAQHGRRLTRKEVKEQLVILMGGRAAQVVKFGEEGIDAGAADDLAKALELARQAIQDWGMDSTFFDTPGKTVATWLQEAEAEAERLLRDNLDHLEARYVTLIQGPL